MAQRFTPGGIYLFVGRTNSGKTHLLTYIAWLMQHHFDAAFGFCPTIFASNISFVRRRFAKFDKRMLTTIMEYQAKQVEQGTAENVLLVFDDIIGEDSVKTYGSLLGKLFTCSRHYKITIFITTQYLYKVPPVLRENCKFVFICSSDNPTDRKRIHDEFCRGDKRNFDKWLDVCSEPGYSSLVIDCYAKDVKNAYMKITPPKTIREFEL